LLSVTSTVVTLLPRALLVDQADQVARRQLLLLRLLVAVVARDRRVLDQVHKAVVVRRVRSDTT
jgi:hypothetical protein